MPIEIIVVGAGARARTHLHAYQQVSGFKIVGICDVDIELARVAARNFKIPTIAASLTELKNAQAVHICTPTSTHHELVKWALQNDYHVFCEKPFGCNCELARRLVDLAKARKRVLQVGYHLIHDPQVQTLSEYVSSGTIGTVVLVDLRFTHCWGGRRPSGWRADPTEAGSGVLFDLGAHLLHTAEYLYGPVSEIAAHLSRNGRGLDETGQCALVFQNGGLGHCFFSWQHAAGRELAFRLDGTEASLVFEEKHAISQLRLEKESGNRGRWQYSTTTSFYPRKGINQPFRRRAIPREVPTTAAVAQLMDFANQIKGVTVDGDSGARAVRTLQLIEAALESERAQAYIRV